MKQEIKKQWVTALRDGTRKQGQGYLRNAAGEQCCLDILCELAVDAGVIEPPNLKTVGDHENVMVYAYHSNDGLEDFHYIPRAVQVWAGLEGYPQNPSNPYITYNPEGEDGRTKSFGQVGLASLNDEHYLNFEQIADLIEEQL